MFSHKSFYSMFWPSGEETNGPDVGLHNKKRNYASAARVHAKPINKIGGNSHG